MDNTIVVWDVEKLPSTVAILKGHKGHVKGVTWDPVGKYLASQSADKTLRVWRTSDWVEEASISEPFEECGGTTHVLRCDWSPDGQEQSIVRFRTDLKLNAIFRILSCVSSRYERWRPHSPDIRERRLEV